MKKVFLALALPVAALLMQSCSEDDFQEPSRVDSGVNIRFDAKLDYDPVTRTWYGGQTTDQTGQTVWPIYWNTDGSDHIFVYSPQALTGRTQGAYTVKPKEGDKSIAAEITVDTESGVQASDAATYNFYAIYPASAVTGQATGNTITASLSAEQVVTYADINSETGVKTQLALPEKPATGSVVYNMAPDMNSCIMIANEPNVTLDANSPVTLKFKPFSSVLDITVQGPADNNTVTNLNECAVTSIVIEANAPIAGDFTYDFAAPAGTNPLTFGANKSNLIEISTMGDNVNGDKTGVPMANDNKLHLQAFLLPNPDVSDIKIKVYTSDSQIWTKTLTMTADGAQLFKPSQIHKVLLPTLKFAEAKFDFSRWISQLDPRIYLSEISLPGSTSSFSWKEGASNPMQTLTAVQQFKAGIRVFRCHIWLYDMVSNIDHKSPAFGINVNGSTYIRPLGEVIEDLYNEMQKNHSDEFCVLMVSDNKQVVDNATATNPFLSPENISWNTDNGKTFYERFKVISQEMQRRGYIPDHIDANTTIADVKGKIILKLQLNANGNYDGGPTLVGWAFPNELGGVRGYEGMNNLLTKISGWSAVDGSKALLNWWTGQNGRNIFYAPMTYGTVGSISFTADDHYSSGNGGKGKFTTNIPGLSSQAAQLLSDNASYSSIYGWRSNCNLLQPPSDFDDPSKIWYIYGAQANPSRNYEYNAGYDMIEQIVSAIKTHYKTDGETSHNKFFMTYLGGAGNAANQSTVTARFVPQWNTLTSEANFGTNRPFGWVLFNGIPNPDTPDESLTATSDILVRNGIKRVISRNNDVVFKLQRKKDTPNGDTKGVVNGPSLF